MIGHCLSAAGIESIAAAAIAPRIYFPILIARLESLKCIIDVKNSAKID
jgi:hypothetical protein